MGLLFSTPPRPVSRRRIGPSSRYFRQTRRVRYGRATPTNGKSTKVDPMAAWYSYPPARNSTSMTRRRGTGTGGPQHTTRKGDPRIRSGTLNNALVAMFGEGNDPNEGNDSNEGNGPNEEGSNYNG